MTQPVDLLFPHVEPGKVPYWRLALRGCSQLCFQTNELTGLLFLAAVLVASPIAAAYMLAAAIIAPGARMLLGDRGVTLETGLPGLNPSLIAVSLPAFYQTGWTNLEMWGVLILCVIWAVLLVKLLLAILPFPILVFPFLIIFWVLAAIAPYTEILEPVKFSAEPTELFRPWVAVLFSLGQALFSPTILSGVLFLAGILLSNWRHAVIAVMGAVIGTAVSYYYRDVDPVSVNLGLYGFNGVLAAVAAYVTCGAKLRLAVLGAILATILIPAVAHFGVQSLSAPFVFTTWLLLLLGWIDVNWFQENKGSNNNDGPTTDSIASPKTQAGN
ncbi:urea transporter [Hoeflea poritis]|uniref:Urea transporter n=1 Tax=Hoeflea poritis TaxID=2993659 RepID=A0ABT4VK06_9HYPH|nr:urea transporter [Hoeflea poritis]MDA4845057.1 urea transporter [Hoeflea poritis]